MARRISWQRIFKRVTRERVALLGLLLAVVFGITANGALHAGNYRMGQNGADTSLIGYATAVQALGIVMAAPLMVLLRRMNKHSNLALMAGAAAGTGFLGTFFSDSIGMTFASRFLLGAGIGLGMAITEYLVVSRVRRDVRPVFAVMFGILLAAGHAAGTFLTIMLAVNAILLTILAALLIGSLLLAPWGRLPDEQDDFSFRDLPRIISLSPATFLAAGLFGFLDNGLLSMLPDFFFHSGITKDDMVLTSFAAFAGVCAFQIPAGILVMRYPPALLIRAAVLALIAAVMIMLQTANIQMVRIPMAFILGGLIDVIYTIGLVNLAIDLPRRSLAGANACFVSVCGLGEVMGPTVTGPSLQSFGVGGGTGVVLFMLVGCWFAWAYRDVLHIAPAMVEAGGPPAGLPERRLVHSAARPR